MNVRCPNCSAVFPAAIAANGVRQPIECPLCLLRFEPSGEETISLPEMPASPTGASAPSEDEFEAFGAPAPPLDTTTTVVPQSFRLGGPATAGPRATLPRGRPDPSMPPQRTSNTADSQEIDFNAADPSSAIDFSALLSDAVHAVEKPQGRSAFGRIGAPRAGAGAIEESILAGRVGAARPPQPLAPPPSDPDSLFEAAGSVPMARDDDLDVPVTPGRGDGSGPATRRLEPVSIRSKAKKATSSSGKGLVAVLLGVLGAGAAADFLGYGFMASKLWLPADPAATRKMGPVVSADLEKPLPLLDTQATYQAEIKRLQAVLVARPDDAAAQATLADRLLDLLERNPAVFDADPALRKDLDAAVARVPGVQPRLAVLDQLAAHGPGAEAAFGALVAPLDAGGLDDQAVAARARLVLFERRLEAGALATPGLTAAPEQDPLRLPPGNDIGIKAAAAQIAKLRPQFATAPNRIKLVLLDAALRDRLARYDAKDGEPDLVALLEPIAKAATDHIEARVLLASAHLEQSRLDQADGLTAEALRLAGDQLSPAWQRRVLLVQARIAGRRGDRSALVKTLQTSLLAIKQDELTTIRLARLLLAERRLDEGHKLLQTAKKEGLFKSVAFEVALVEYWLAVNRNEDALAELVEATRLYPDSVDLLYLRGQVEDKQQHSATARDYFTQVLAREPRHLRAILRLGELQGTAGRHDEALATLSSARKLIGDDEALLKLIAEELVLLRREVEARQVLSRLLEIQPDNRQYLLRAAQMDLKVGEVDRALGFLRQLRKLKALDREAAIQMAVALAGKGQPDEAAATLMPFAEQAPTDIVLNTAAGRFLIDSKDYDRAQTVLGRATSLANGKSGEALFQFGRLAFRRGEVDQGISRMKQAIDVDGLAHEYRFELARSLFDLLEQVGARGLAVVELQTIAGGAEMYDKAGRKVTYLADVHRMLARHFSELHRYPNALPHLREVRRLAPNDVDALVQLGKALHLTGSPEAADVLRRVLRHRPGDGPAALYLGLHALAKGRSSEALAWLQQAAQGGSGGLAEAWYHVALIQKERGQDVPALKAVEQYLRQAPADEPYRKDAEGLRRSLGGGR